MLIRARVHPFPFRTRQLSPFLLTILGWRRPGKIGSANTGLASMEQDLRHSSIAQSVEHAAVNRGVVGSSPTGGAKSAATLVAALFLFQKSGIDNHLGL